MAGIFDMAKDLGNALARTDEYQNLKRASDAAEEDRDLVDLKNRIQSIEAELEASLQSGQEPSEELRSSYAKTAEELQAMPAFQRVIAAQTNFEKTMYKVNETVAKGIEEGAQESHHYSLVSVLLSTDLRATTNPLEDTLKKPKRSKRPRVSSAYSCLDLGRWRRHLLLA